MKNENVVQLKIFVTIKFLKVKKLPQWHSDGEPYQLAVLEHFRTLSIFSQTAPFLRCVQSKLIL